MSNGTNAGGTYWEIALKDYVTAPLKKLTEYASGTQKKINDVSGSLDKVAKTSISSTQEIRRSYNNQEQYLKTLKKEIKNTFDDKEITWYKKKIAEATGELEKMKKTIAPDKSFMGEAGSGLKNSLSQIPGVGGMVGLATNPIAIGVTAVGGALYESGKHALDFQEGMAKINATSQLSNETLVKLQNRLEEIGSKSGGNFDKITESYNLIYKQTHLVNRSLDILEGATKAAQAGFVDLDVASESAARMSQVLGKEYKNSTEIFDTFFATIKHGGGDLSSVMNILPNLTELGKGAGLKFKDTAGIFTFFTSLGEKAEQANTDMMAVFKTLESEKVITKFKEADKNLYDKKGHLKRAAFSKGSLSLFDEKGEMKNFDKIIESLKFRMDGMSGEMKIKFLEDLGIDGGRVAKTFLKLTEESDKLKLSIDAVNKSGGALDDAFKNSDHIKRTWGDVGDQWKEIGTDIGKVLLPEIDLLTRAVGGLGHAVKFAFHDMWKDLLKEDTSILDAVKDKIVGEYAKKATDMVWGKLQPWQVATEGRLKYQNEKYDYYHDWIYGTKNDIIKGEKKTSQIPLPESVSNPKEKEEKDKPLTGSSGGVRTLIMNVNNSNTIRGEKDREAMRKVCDDLVDAARDAMTTIGM